MQGVNMNTAPTLVGILTKITMVLAAEHAASIPTSQIIFQSEGIGEEMTYTFLALHTKEVLRAGIKVRFNNETGEWEWI